MYLNPTKLVEGLLMMGCKKKTIDDGALASKREVTQTLSF